MHSSGGCEQELGPVTFTPMCLRFGDSKSSDPTRTLRPYKQVSLARGMRNNKINIQNLTGTLVAPPFLLRLWSMDVI